MNNLDKTFLDVPRGNSIMDLKIGVSYSLDHFVWMVRGDTGYIHYVRFSNH